MSEKLKEHLELDELETYKGKWRTMGVFKSGIAYGWNLFSTLAEAKECNARNLSKLHRGPPYFEAANGMFRKDEFIFLTEIPVG